MHVKSEGLLAHPCRESSYIEATKLDFKCLPHHKVGLATSRRASQDDCIDFLRLTAVEGLIDLDCRDYHLVIRVPSGACHNLKGCVGLYNLISVSNCPASPPHSTCTRLKSSTSTLSPTGARCQCFGKCRDSRSRHLRPVVCGPAI